MNDMSTADRRLQTNSSLSAESVTPSRQILTSCSLAEVADAEDLGRENAGHETARHEKFLTLNLHAKDGRCGN